MKRLFLSILLVSWTSGTLFAATSNIAVIDLEKIFQHSKQVMEIRQQIHQQFLPRQEKILMQQKKVAQMVQDFNKNHKTMTEQQRKDTAQKIMSARKILSAQMNDYRNNLNKVRDEAMNKILAKVKDRVKDVAEKNHFDLVLLRSSVPYSSSSLDVTDQVLSKMQ